MFQERIRKFKAYLNRDKFIGVTGDIDPWEYHEMFVTWSTYFSVMVVDKLTPKMYILPLISIFSASFGAVLFIMTLVHYTIEMKLPIMIESGSFLLLMVYQLTITFSILFGRKEYKRLLTTMKEDFSYVCAMKKHRDEFFESQALTFKGVFGSAFVLIAAGSGMALLACVGVGIAIYFQDEGEPRPLPISLWVFDYDLHASPLYEFFFGSFFMFVYSYASVYSFNAMSNVIWVRQIVAKVDIINWNLEDVMDGVVPTQNKAEKEYHSAQIRHRMGKVIKMHLDLFTMLEEYAGVYKKCLLFEQSIASPVICMTAYGFVKNYEEGGTQYLLLPLCLGVVIMVFVPNYLCSHLRDKVESIGDACWDIPFWNAGVTLRPYLILIMQRSLRRLPIEATGFSEISLSTYNTTITRAYSGFNLLRQADLDFS